MWAASKRLVSHLRAYYKEINTATLSGANDIIVVEQPDGTLVSSPFSVRFGKLGVMRSNATEVYIDVNGEPCDLKMVLSSKGEAFFLLAGTDYSELLDAEASDESAAAVGHADDTTGLGRLVRVYSDGDLYASGRQHGADSGFVTPQGGVFAMDMHDISGEPGESKELTSVSLSSMELQTARHPSAQHQQQQQQRQRYRHVTGSDSPSSAAAALAAPMIEVAIPAGRAAAGGWLTVEQSPGDHCALSSSGGGAGSTGSPWHLSASPPQLSASVPRIGVQPTANRGQADGACTGTQPAAEAPSKAVQPMPQSVERRPKAGEQGIYLADLDNRDLTPEVMALYFPERNNVTAALEIKCSHADDEDAESGQSTLSSRSPTFVVDFAMSPNSASQLSRSSTPVSDIDSGSAEHGHPYSYFRDVSLSLCGGLKDGCGSISMDKFHHHLVTFEDFCKDPGIVDNPNLVVRLHGRLLNWKVASVVMMAAAAYHCPLPVDLVDALIKQHMPPKMEERRKGLFSSWWHRSTKADAPPKQEPPPVPQPSATDGTAASGGGAQLLPAPSAAAAAAVDSRSQASLSGAATSAAAAPGSVNSSPKKTAPAVDASVPIDVGIACKDGIMLSGGEDRMPATGDGKTAADDSERTMSGSGGTVAGPAEQLAYVKQRWKTPTSEQLVQLKLQPGRNDIEFSVTTALQGTTRCTSSIYLWKWTDQIVVSDIDGTITRSDVLGQLLPMVGKDWSQVDVAKLYTKMAENGYKFVYLSARAIGQSQMTRDFLSSVRQQQATLPPGPLFLSPTSLYTAFHKEVIERKPEEFKISCLRNLKALFPKTMLCPLYAGFGNKINDVWAYRAVDIPASRVFTINTRGELRSELSQTFMSSYSKLSDLVDHFFPPVRSIHGGGGGAGHLHEASEYSSFAYWRQPLPTLLPSLSSSPAATTVAATAAAATIAPADGAANHNNGPAARMVTTRTVESRAGA